MGIRTVIFDVGNTLIVPESSVPEEMCLLGREFGYEIGLEEARDAYALAEDAYNILLGDENSFWADSEMCEAQWRAEYRMAFEYCGVSEGLDELVDSIYTHYLYAEGWRILDDAKALLAALSERGVQCAVVSNWDCNLPELLGELGLTEYFDSIVTSAGAEIYKPLPGIFKACLEELDVPASECVYIGDVPAIDGEGAESAGLHVVIIDRKDKHPDCEYPRICDLIEVLETL